MSEIFNTDKDIHQELQLKLLMLESSLDEPIHAANMISLVKQTYEHHNKPIPSKIRKFLDTESERIAPLIQEMIKKKTYVRNLWIDEKLRNQQKAEDIQKQKEDEQKAKSMSRTELIFGKE